MPAKTFHSFFKQIFLSLSFFFTISQVTCSTSCLYSWLSSSCWGMSYWQRCFKITIDNLYKQHFSMFMGSNIFCPYLFFYFLVSVLYLLHIYFFLYENCHSIFFFSEKNQTSNAVLTTTSSCLTVL